MVQLAELRCGLWLSSAHLLPLVSHGMLLAVGFDYNFLAVMRSTGFDALRRTPGARVCSRSCNYARRSWRSAVVCQHCRSGCTHVGFVYHGGMSRITAITICRCGRSCAVCRLCGLLIVLSCTTMRRWCF